MASANGRGVLSNTPTLATRGDGKLKVRRYMTEATAEKEPDTTEETEPSPDQIMQVGSGFWPSKVLLAAVDLGLFTHLADGGLRASEIERKLDLHPRATRDFLDALLSLGFLEREGVENDPLYRNTPETGAFLNEADPRYIGGALDIFNNLIYEKWANLEESLKTGEPRSIIEESGESFFDELYSDPERLKEFMEGMAGLSAGNFHAFVEEFDFSDYETMTDVGGALGNLSRLVAQRESHLSVTTLDLPPVTELAEQKIRNDGLGDRIEAVARDFTEEPIPDADLVTASLILHGENLQGKKMLIDKIYDAVNAGGTFVAIDNIIDDERRENTFGLLMSLNMLIQFGDAFDYTGAQFEQWATEAGFDDVEISHLNGPTSMAIAHKR